MPPEAVAQTVAKPDATSPPPPAPPPAKKPRGAPRGNSNRMLGGERSRLPLRKSSKADTYMIGKVNEWRRELETKLREKFGEIGLHQEAKIVTALQWELARRRRNQLSNAATTKAEQVQHDEMAAVDCERRDRAIEQAGLSRASGKEHDADNPWAGLQQRLNGNGLHDADATPGPATGDEEQPQ
jgi:hypothetical protein